MSAIALEFPTVTDVSSLTQSTVFLKMHFGNMGNSRKVKVTTVTDAAQDWIDNNKRLLESPELKAIGTSQAQFMASIKKLCLPYDDGILFLPLGMLETVNPMLMEYQTVTRPALVQRFLDVYQDQRELARRSLGTLYNPRDYPTPDGIRGKFTFTFSYLSFGVPGQLASVSPAIYHEQTEKMQRDLQAAADEITLYMRQEAFSKVQHLATRLTPKPDGGREVLHATAVTHLQDFLATFPLRNVRNDTELQAVMTRVRSLVDGVSVESLKTREGFREQIRLGLDRASELLGGMVQERATRRFRD